MSNVDIVRRAYEAMTNRDVETVIILLDPQVEWGQPEALPWGGTYRGPQEVLEFFGKVNEYIEGLRVDSDEYLDAGSSIVVLGRVRGTARRSGVRFAVRLAHVWRVREGKIVWFYNFADTAALLAAIGEGSNSAREN
jgi:ketosteroid isomerase-like protein